MRTAGHLRRTEGEREARARGWEIERMKKRERKKENGGDEQEKE